MASLLAVQAEVVLMCWEHDHLVNVAGAVPAAWPGDRFDVIWRFDLDEQAAAWTFSSLDQQLLAGDLSPGAPAT